jgi:peptidoglycan/LPS O-acetylase OafA/YrhL
MAETGAVLSKTATSLQEIARDLNAFLHAKVISGLDALRALAVILVLADHLLATDYLFGIHPPLGPLGVTIFFVLSGFLITSMLLTEHRKTGGIDLRDFYRRRAYRIFPTFYCCWLLTMGFEYLTYRLDWKSGLVSFFYLMDYGRALIPESVRPYLSMGISWSLGVEEKFYLLWPLLLLTLLKRRRLRRKLVLIILGLWIYRAVLYLALHVSWAWVYHTFDMRADGLLVGCLTSIVVRSKRMRPLCCYPLRWQWMAVIPPLALWLLMIPSPDNKAIYLLAWSVQPLVVAVMLLQIIYWGAKSWSVCRLAAVRFVAHISYALYLYHQLAGEIVYVLRVPHLGFSTAALTLLMSTASYYFVERPFMRMRDRQAQHV